MCHHYHFTYMAHLTLDEIKMIKEPSYHTTLPKASTHVSAPA